MELVVYSSGTISYFDCMKLSRLERELFAKTLTDFFNKKAGKDTDDYL